MEVIMARVEYYVKGQENNVDKTTKDKDVKEHNRGGPESSG